MANFWSGFLSGFAKNMAKEMLAVALAEAITQVHTEIDSIPGASDEEKAWSKKGVGLVVERLNAYLTKKNI